MQMKYECYICRVIRAVKVYTNPTDIKPSSYIVHPGDLFLSNKQAVMQTNEFFQITASPNEEIPNLPYESWIPKGFIEFTKVDVIESEIAERLPVSCDETFIVKDDTVTIYLNSQSNEVSKYLLCENDIIEVDQVVTYREVNQELTRYRIKSVNRYKNHPVVGLWMEGNPVFLQRGNRIRYDLRNVLEKTESNVPINKVTKVRMNTDSGIETYDILWKPEGEFGVIKNPLDLVKDNPKPGQSIVADTDKSLSEAGVDKDESTSATTTDTVDTRAAELDKITYSSISGPQAYEELYKQYGMTYYGESMTSVPIGRMIFVHGMPFQYTYVTYRRLNNSSRYGQESLSEGAIKSGSLDMYGRDFAENIAGNMPIASILPGVPVFLTNIKQSILGTSGGQDSDAQAGWLPIFSDLSDSQLADSLEAMMDSTSDAYQYYSMEINTTEYFNFVNALCNTVAKFMGLSNFKYRNQNLGSFDWGSYNSDASQDYNIFQEIAGLEKGVSFAFDPLSSVSDSLSNSTGESEFAGLFNNVSSKARELEFMIGSAGANLDLVDSTEYTATLAELGEGFTSGISNPLSVITTLLKNAAHGMNVRFPLIWNDTSYSKSYDLDMRFITPYATAFCKYRYVLVPFLHIFTFAAPQSKDTVINYSRPYLIKAYSRGYFNVEMGMIDTIQWKRFGDGDMISEDGIPTQIDVSVSFQDLYQQVAISMFNGEITADISRIGIFFNNTGLMDLLGSLAGINTNRVTLGERLSLISSSAVGAFSATGENFMRHIGDKVRNSSIVRFLFGS